MQKREKLKEMSGKNIGKNFFNMMIDNKFESKISDNYIQLNLAMDFYSRFNYEEYFNEEITARMRVEMIGVLFYNYHYMKNNISQFRAILYLAHGVDRKRKSQGLPLSEDKNERSIFRSLQGFKKYRDLVDLDIIQFACLGAFDQFNKLLPATIVASVCEEKSIKERIRLFKKALKSINNLDGLTYEKIEFLNGEVIFVNFSNGHIKRIINVSDVN